MLIRPYHASSNLIVEKYSKLLKIPGDLLSTFIAVIFSRVTFEETHTDNITAPPEILHVTIDMFTVMSLTWSCHHLF